MQTNKTLAIGLTLTLLLLVSAGIGQAQGPAQQGQTVIEGVGVVTAATALDTSITYQGRLTDGGSPATGTYDLTFLLRDGPSSGNLVGNAVELDDVVVADGYGRTPLHDAAAQGHLAVVQLLLAQGADVHARTRYGYTALHYAARHAHTAIAHLLVERGAPVHAVVERGGEGGHTPLDYARAAGDAELVACLVARGATPGREYTPQKVEPLPCPVCAEPRLVYDGSVRWRSGPRPPRSLATKGSLGTSPRADYENAHYLHCQNCATKLIDHSDHRDYSIVHVEDGPGCYRYDRPTRRWESRKW